MVKSGYFYFFHLFEALNDTFEVQFFKGFIFYTFSKTLIVCMAVLFFHLHSAIHLNRNYFPYFFMQQTLRALKIINITRTGAVKLL